MRIKPVIIRGLPSCGEVSEAEVLSVKMKETFVQEHVDLLLDDGWTLCDKVTGFIFLDTKGNVVLPSVLKVLFHLMFELWIVWLVIIVPLDDIEETTKQITIFDVSHVRLKVREQSY